MKRLILLTLLLALAGCATVPRGVLSRNAESDLASLRKQLEDIHASRDAAAFSALHADAAVVEWRGRPATAVGRAALESSRRELWAARRELRLNLQVSDLRLHADRAYEFGSYEESWIDPKGSRVTEFGRYVTAYAREADGQWRIARSFGYADLIATNSRRE